jgi:hypothetical protein
MKLRRLAMLAMVAAGLASTWACDKPVQLLAPNQRPVVRITGAPLDSTQRNYYVITLDWIGFDPDGRVDHFLLAFDPPTVAGTDTAWETTTDHSRTRSFPCPLPDRPDSMRSSDFHVFVVKAVDNLGAVSAPVARAFWSYTLAPRVEMRVPPARALVTYYLPPGVLFSWEGFDDDGVFTQKPVKYKFILLDESTEVKLSTANRTPDAVRQYYAPRNWAGWDSLPGDTTQKQYTNLTPDKTYMFVVVAFDEAGAYSPIFNRDNNMVLFKVTYAGAQNPRIGVFNDFFLYEYDQGSNRPGDPSQIVHVEVPAADPRNPDDKLAFNWYASPVRDSRGNPISGPIRSYRWAVDMTDTEDETPRVDDNDLSHWSERSTLITSCRIGPYAGRQTHMFLIQAEDINGLRSLGQVEFTTTPATFEKSLLVVDDTRYLIDGIAPNTNCYSPSNRPKQNWPTQAELDTFLYARGGVQWKCYPPVNGQPVRSTPGIFNGYDFDTVGTNIGVYDLTVRLSALGKYRHVVWLVDRLGSLSNGRGTNQTDAMTALRYMNDNGRTNTLAAYVRQGGQVWLVGNAGTASMINFNNTNNDNQPPIPNTLTFSNDPAMKELIPGRFMYNQAHWRSEFKQWIVYNGRIKRYLGRFEGAPGIYAGLPQEISMKSSATDPFPPNRENQSPAYFYQPQFDAEFLTAPNDILEDLDPGPREDFESTLDTLYKVTAASVQPDTGRAGVQNVVMTRYHGLENREFLVTGFPIWNFQRSQCQALVDFVLGQMWGVFPHAPAAAVTPVRAQTPATASTLSGGRGRPTPLRPRR